MCDGDDLDEDLMVINAVDDPPLGASGRVVPSHEEVSGLPTR